MATCHSLDSDPIEIFLRSRIPLATAAYKIEESIASSSLKNVPLSPSSSTSSDAPLVAQSTKAKKTKNGKLKTNNVKMERSLESVCLGEIGTGFAWLKDILKTKNPHSIQGEMDKASTKPTLTDGGKVLLRQMMNSVLDDDACTSSTAPLKHCWSFLRPVSSLDQSHSPTPSSSLFVELLKIITSHEAVNDETTQRGVSHLNIFQIIKSLQSYFSTSKSIAKNIPPGMDSNQIICAALAFLSTPIPILDAHVNNEGDQDEPSLPLIGTILPLDYFPSMPLLLQESSTNSNKDETSKKSFKKYFVNKSNLKSSFLQEYSFVTKLLNLEASFWASTSQYPSRLRVIPRIEDVTREKSLLFMGGTTKSTSEGAKSGSSSSKKGGKKIGSCGSATKRKSADAQTNAKTDSKLTKKKKTANDDVSTK